MSVTRLRMYVFLVGKMYLFIYNVYLYYKARLYNLRFEIPVFSVRNCNMRAIKGDITLNTIRLWYRYYSPFSNPFTILHITFVNIVLDCDGEETQIQVLLTVYVVSIWLWLYNSDEIVHTSIVRACVQN